MVKPFRRQEIPHRPYVSNAAAVCETTTELATTEDQLSLTLSLLLALFFFLSSLAAFFFLYLAFVFSR